MPESDLLLNFPQREGGSLTLRPIVAVDADGLLCFFLRVSEEEAHFLE
jgi:hypothetical protein